MPNILKLGKVAGKLATKFFSESGAKVTEEAVKATSKVSKVELKAAKNARKVEGALKSVGNPTFEKGGVKLNRFVFDKGKFWDLKRGGYYTRQEFSKLQSHFGNLYGNPQRSYKAWEASLPKANFIPKFNMSNAARAEAKVAEQVAKGEAKVAGQTAKAATKVAAESKGAVKEAAETVAKQRWFQNPNNLKAAYKEAKHGAKYAVDNSWNIAKTAGVGYIGWNILSGKGLIHPVLDSVKGDTEKSFAEDLIDTSFGEGTYGYMKGGLGSVVGEGVDIYQGVKGTVTGVSDEVANIYQGGKDMMAGAFTGNGMVSDGSGNYYDPTMEQYPSMNQMTGMQQQQGNGLMSGLMGGMNNAVNTISGGNVSKMNLAGLLLSAYMMFGRFGWLGKAASLMLGGMTLKNINSHQNTQQMQMQQQQGQQQNYGVATPISPNQGLRTAELPVDNEEDVVVRSRGI